MDPIREVSILIVDDEPDNLQAIANALYISENTYLILKAPNGQIAMTLAEKRVPDLVITDWEMPVMDGIELIYQLKNNSITKDIPVIMCTGVMTTSENLQIALDAGAVDYVRKPIDKIELRARIRSILMISDQQQCMNSLNESLELRNHFIKGVFGRYLSDEIVEELLKTPKGLKLGGEKRTLTLLMSDLRGFTSLTESFSAEQVLDILNHYLETMTEIIFQHQGTIDEIIGDGLLVIFGAPIFREDDAQRAVACALDMQLAMGKVNRWNQTNGYPNLSQGIGINTGEMVVGNIGSLKRTKYGVVGREVNLTARIESYTVGGQILVSESTRNDCQSELSTDGILEVFPKGCSGKIKIFDIRGILGDPGKMLQVKHPEKMIIFSPAREVTFMVLSGKDVVLQSFRGKITSWSDTRVELDSEVDLKPFDNIKIIANDLEIYGKIMCRLPRGGFRFEVVFTSLSMDSRMFLEKLVILDTN